VQHAKSHQEEAVNSERQLCEKSMDYEKRLCEKELEKERLLCAKDIEIATLKLQSHVHAPNDMVSSSLFRAFSLHLLLASQLDNRLMQSTLPPIASSSSHPPVRLLFP
jgi:hypothetical protein